MEEKNKQNNLQTYKKASLFKRFVCLLLVLSMMLSMTGCVYIDGQPVSLLEGAVYVIGGFLRAGTLILGDLAILCVTWVLDKITWPLYPVTGFNMDKPAGFLFRTWHRLIDPNKVHGDWSDMGEAEFHEEHPLTIWEKRKGETETDEDIQIQATTDPTQPTESHDKKGGIPNTGGNPPDGIPIIEDGQSIPKTGDDSSGFLDKIFTNDPDDSWVKVTYDANFGYNPPKASYYMPGIFSLLGGDPLMRILGIGPVKNPFRSGYHFMGWSRDPLATTAEFEAGNPDWNIKEDTTLYAVWQEFNPSQFMSEHKYTIVQAADNSPIVNITCSCGLPVSAKDISHGDFMNMYFYWYPYSATTEEMNHMHRLYLLYKAQYIGPLALEYNTSFYQKDVKEAFTNLASDLVDIADETAGGIEDISEINLEELLEKYTKIPLDKDAFAKVIETASKGAEVISKGVSFFHAANAFYKTVNSNPGILTQVEGFLDLLDCASSAVGADTIVQPITQTLKEGLNLVDAAAEVRENYVTVMDQTLKEVGKTYSSPLLSTVFPNNPYPSYMLDSLINAGGHSCDHTTSSCLFNTPSSNDSMSRLHTFPTIYEAQMNLGNWSGNLENANEVDLKILFFYLAERSRYELAQAVYGMTVEQYAQLVAGTLPVSQYPPLY